MHAIAHMGAKDHAERRPLRVLYLSPSPPPKIQGTDGLFSEIEYVCRIFGGEMLSLSPAQFLPTLLPISFYGMQLMPALKRHSNKADLIHLFFPYIVNFRILRYISKPVIYTITTGADTKCISSSGPDCTFVVSSSHEADVLRSKGFSNINVICPGIDDSQIRVTPPSKPIHEFVLLVGSAPWTKHQFVTKGFDLLLEVLTRLPRIRLICLWRGTLYREWAEKVRLSGHADRVDIVQDKIDISGILSRCHAAVVLSETPDLVKSYPNSLMEALAAGRPVLISRSLPMSYYVEDTSCGRVIENLCTEELINAIEELIDDYSTYAAAALVAGHGLSATDMIENYGYLYQKVSLLR
jgi:glycosyltransferase involved in cell wall biosynthesis